MASIRGRARNDGTYAYHVLYRLKGRQSSLTFDDLPAAEAFIAAAAAHGAERALAMHGLDPIPRRTATDRQNAMTVVDWVNHHVEHLSGVDKRTVDDYRGYVRTDIGPAFGAMPLAALSRDDVARWVTDMHTVKGSAAKTIANKHALLSAALSAAVVAGHIPTNPAAGTRLPRDEPSEMVFLERDQFFALLAEIPDAWKPLVEFLVASGCRWSEATALKPSDVDRARGTVRITRAWKRSPYRIGPPKTRKSVRTINVSTSVLDKLDYTGEWLFTNPGRGRTAKGGPVRAPNFRANVWNPAVKRTWPDGLRPRIHDCRHTCASWLIQAGRPLPAVQAHLGHENINTTISVYTHLDRESGQGNADALGAMLSAKPDSDVSENKRSRTTRGSR